MILPIYVYGEPLLRVPTIEIEEMDSEIHQLIENMWETMYNANGVGLACPQVGFKHRMFIVDTQQLLKEGKEPEVPITGIKKVFINPQLISENGEEWNYEEGCLSIPEIRGDVMRKPNIEIEYYDENLEKVTKKYTGIEARVIQHEYDHLEGILFTDKISPLKRTLFKRKLEKMRKGRASADYPLKGKN